MTISAEGKLVSADLSNDRAYGAGDRLTEPNHRCKISAGIRRLVGIFVTAVTDKRRRDEMNSSIRTAFDVILIRTLG